jgi:hypothetical protein
MNNRDELLADMAELARRLIPIIGDDDSFGEDSAPSMQVTIGCECPSADSMSWSYQTGDNSYTGGAYGYAFWGIGYLYRDTDPADFARQIVSSLEEDQDFDYGSNT